MMSLTHCRPYWVEQVLSHNEQTMQERASHIGRNDMQKFNMLMSPSEGCMHLLCLMAPVQQSG